MGCNLPKIKHCQMHLLSFDAIIKSNPSALAACSLQGSLNGLMSSSFRQKILETKYLLYNNPLHWEICLLSPPFMGPIHGVTPTRICFKAVLALRFFTFQ